MMKHFSKHIHFIGIGGIGMSGIASILLDLGYKVSGSDIIKNNITEHLRNRGASIYLGHHPKNISTAEIVVISTAIKEDNSEILYAYSNKIPIVSRAAILGELMQLKQSIAIAGTHGKTTTTSLLAAILIEENFDPAFVIGGVLNSVNTNARWGSGDFFVVEADESDASFLHLLPTMEIITNIDTDHMETYHHDINQLKQAFLKFIHKMPFYGVVTICSDDKNLRDILPFISRSILSYGLSSDANVSANNIERNGIQTKFTVLRKNMLLDEGMQKEILNVTLNLPGLHNIYNALASIAVATQLGISDQAIIYALKKFQNVNRRFQYYGNVLLPNGSSCPVIDDYGHHPVEIAATIDAVRSAFPKRSILLVFQPHRYTRTKDCFWDFVKILQTVDTLLLTDVYSAGESFIFEADGQSLIKAIKQSQLHQNKNQYFIENFEELPETILNTAHENDVILIMGAGNISEVPIQLMNTEHYK